MRASSRGQHRHQRGGAWSVDGSSSVTERIMGRMKLKLSHFGSIHLKSNTPRRSGSFGGGGGSNNNNDIGVGRRSCGSGRFGIGRIRRKSESRNNPFDFDRSDEDLGGVVSAGFRRRRSSSWSKTTTVSVSKTLTALARVYTNCCNDGKLTDEISNLVESATSKSQFSQLQTGEYYDSCLFYMKKYHHLPM